MTDVSITFIPFNKDPLDIINLLKNDLDMSLKRNEISEYEIDLPNPDGPQGEPIILIHKAKPQPEPPEETP
jgi:hypothetical protein